MVSVVCSLRDVLLSMPWLFNAFGAEDVCYDRVPGALFSDLLTLENVLFWRFFFVFFT